MTVQVTIIGLGQIGTSIGLALAEHADLVRRIGHDKDHSVARAAEKLGALDEVKINLPDSVREADIVLLSLPVSEIRETLEVIAQDLKEGAVVMDTAPVKGTVTQWAKELLPPERFYVSLVPVINPEYLHEAEIGVPAARTDLFDKGLMMIASSPGTPGEAVKLAADLTRLVGATPFYADLAEADGLMAATHILPQLAAVALLTATVEQPGWREARKVAGRHYAAGTIFPDGPQALREAALHNKDNVVRVLDNLIAALQGLRNSIAQEDRDGLSQRLERAAEDRETWMLQRFAADWVGEELKGEDAPQLGEVLKSVFFGVRKKKGEKK